MTLISEITGIIIAVDVSEIVSFWKLFIWDVLGISILFHEFLSFGLGCSEVFVAWDTEFLFIRSRLILINLGVVIINIRDLSEDDRLVAMGSIVGMRLSVLAHVSFPSQIEVIYS